MNIRKTPIARSLSAIAAASLWAVVPVGPAQAGKIISDFDTSSPVVVKHKATGYGGWSLANIEVLLNPETEEYPDNFDRESGGYMFPADSDNSYYAEVNDGTETVVAQVLAKDWPVGEPPGIKVINDDLGVKNGRPENCIMSTSYLDGAFLDSDNPEPVLCSGPYQSHKRFKVAMLPEILDVGGVDLVFNVEEGEERQYQVFQKINNWTGTRLTGFTIEVGFGVGESFAAAAGDAADNLKLSVPESLWDDTQLATFSAGLFGPLDSHGQIGFYDEKTRAGFFIDEFGTTDGNLGTPKLNATRRLGSNYGDLPRGVEAMNQFGYWLPNNALPYGIFFDDDGNPDTDAELVAWYGYNPSTSSLGWMRGVADKFVAVDDSVIDEYGNNLLYTVGVIDDLVNVGLNYIVTIDDISTFPEVAGNSFTIRISPTQVEEGPDADFPPYVHELVEGEGEWTQIMPEQWVTYTSAPSLMLQPGPVFEVGQVLTARVGDPGADTDSGVIDTVVATIYKNGEEPKTITLFELGEDRAVFAATLPSNYSDVDPGTVISVVYGELEEASTAVTPQEPPVSYNLSVVEFDVPASVSDGLSRTIKARIENDHETLESAAGFVRLTGYVGEESKYDDFDDIPFSLEPGKKMLTKFRWKASLTDSATSESVDWVVEAFVDGVGDSDAVLVASETTSSEVLPKVGKNSKK